VRADRKKLIQAVSNVISNAYKYSPGGSAVGLDLVKSPDVGDVPPRIGIRITDHGIGMTPEQLAHVCERFYRADTSGKIPGTGLGMSIVKEIVELHGGQLELTSKVGAGTTVTLWLPAGDVEVGTQAPDAFPSSPKGHKA
jgi:signal transduction histidine kinase